MRPVLESLVKIFLRKQKSLENLKSELGKFLDERNINMEVKNFYIAIIFDFFTKCQNENVKHNINFKDIERDFNFN
ncbi:hypothetical protein HMPREF9096_00467 [Haemophilus sp. oral taxon 851 str. F0397]|nr:hypothetical protein HMPREF9096_00467 [Haemophilus sp. oral taxon 851 str. F0397]